jgi:hypothetical protein
MSEMRARDHAASGSAEHLLNQDTVLPQGYLHPRYTTSLSEFGQPSALPESGGWLLVRPIRGTPHRDAIGGDRLLFCSDWSRLEHDLNRISDLVTVTAVSDPFANVEPEYLRRCFPDLMVRYKEHYVVDLQRPSPIAHHRAKVRKASPFIQTRVVLTPSAYLDVWEGLYSELRQKHNLSGMRAFSRPAFEQQLTIPGCVAVMAFLDGSCVAMNLWYIMGEIAYSHLTAANSLGYQFSATYPLIQSAIEAFPSYGVRWLNLGAGAGSQSADHDGLAWFKKGWSTGTRPTYLCGRIFDHDTYRNLAGAEIQSLGYFPAYRRGEFD